MKADNFLRELPIKCSKRIYAGSYQGHQCTKPVTVTRDGKHYCKIHDPVEVDRKTVARQAKWTEQRRIDQLRDDIHKARMKVVIAAKVYITSGEFLRLHKAVWRLEKLEKKIPK